jgi:hypothetical protein
MEARIMKTLDQMIAQMTGLRAQSEAHTTLENSIAEQAKANGVILQSLRQQLAEAGNDPAKLAQLGDLIDGLAADQMSEDTAQANVKAALANTDQDPNAGNGTDQGGTTGSTGTGDTGTTDQTGTTGTTATTDPVTGQPIDPNAPAAGQTAAPSTAAPQTDPNAPKPS